MKFLLLIINLSIITTIIGYRCGISEDSLRIIGGKNAKKNRWPWMVRLQIRYKLKSEKYGTIHCGGTLVHPQWIVTAAHCIDSPAKGQLVSVKAIIGGHDTTKKEKRQIEIWCDIAVSHVNYTGVDPYDNDIAMIKLEKPLDFDNQHNYLSPICLPSNNVRVSDENCYATGWGKTSDNQYATILQEVKLPILSDDTCYEAWNDTFSPDKICAGSMKGGIGTCNGDSGGPLQCQLLNGVWVLRGVTSFGSGSKDGYPICDVPDLPGVFTKVENYVNWIRKRFTKYP